MKQARSEQFGDDQCRLHHATGHYRTGIKITQTYIALLRSAVNFDEVIGPRSSERREFFSGHSIKPVRICGGTCTTWLVKSVEESLNPLAILWRLTLKYLSPL
ncbi:hypothetical protein ACFSYD_18100 [Paracoccus aerius]